MGTPFRPLPPLAFLGAVLRAHALGIKLPSLLPPKAPAKALPAPATPHPTARPVLITPGPTPSITVFDPVDSAGNYVPVRFLVNHPNNAFVTVKVRFSKAGGPFQPATAAPNSDRLTDIPAPKVDADYRFIWNAAVDIGQPATTAQLEFEVMSAVGPPAAPVQTRVFNVDTSVTLTPAAPVAPAAPATYSFDIVSGDGQKGISGRLLPHRMVVVLHDANGNGINGARVYFTLGGTVKASIEQDPDYGSLTDWSGQAGVRVRIQPGSTGTGWVTAQVAGLPGVTKQLNFQVDAPKIFDDLPAGTLFQYGYQYIFSVGFDDPVSGQAWFEPDPLNPVKFKLTPTGVILSTNELVLPPDGVNFPGAGRVTFVPTIFNGTATIKVEDESNPALNRTLTIPVQTQTTGRLARHGGTSPTDPVDMRLQVVSGLFSPTQPLAAYPGLTMATTFAAQVSDGTSAYGNVITANRGGCQATPVTATLQMAYSTSGGTLTSSKGTGSLVFEDSGKPVTFLPAGAGPWYILATVNATVLDLHPNPIQWFDPMSRQWFCDEDHGLDVSLQFSFIIQRPAMKVVKAPYTAPSNQPVIQAQPGDTVQIAFGPIAATVAGGKPEQANVQLVDPSTAPYQTPTGMPIPFAQNLNVTTQPGGMVVSDPVVLTRGQPAITLTGPALTLIPGTSIHVSGAGITVNVPVPPRAQSRLLAGDFEMMPDSPAATAPRGGAGSTVLMHSGEFVYKVCDLEHASRGGWLTLTRTYRSGNRCDGLLGPGWNFQHESYMDVTNQYWTDWITSDGQRLTLVPGWSQAGVFAELTTSTAITGDQSAYQIMDAHRNVLHFHADGLLRFFVDRFGNKTTYEYDALGHLARVIDPLKHTLSFIYWQKGDPVDPLTYGKIRSVTDFAGRIVTFDYYAAGDPHGPAGLLKTVTPPAADTLVNGALIAGYKRTETYWYGANPQDRLDVFLQTVVDSEQRPWVTNTPFTDRRIMTQSLGIGSFQFTYDTVHLTSTMIDRLNSRVDYTFTAAIDWSAACPSAVTIYGNPALGGSPDRNFKVQSNGDGLRTHLESPGGEVSDYVYDPNATARARANLLTLIKSAPGAPTRTWSWFYEDRYNQLQYSVSPRGNAQDENPWSYRMTYMYDYQRGAGDQGNIVEITLPRTLNWTVDPQPSGLRNAYWMDENPTIYQTWNSFGLLTSWTDAQGVMTELAYYPEGDPFGTGGSPPQAGGGGLLATCTRDTQLTGDRNRHFHGVPLAPLATTFRYSDLGDVLDTVDPAGIVMRTTRNVLHEVIETRERFGRPDEIWTEYALNEDGDVTRTTLHQPNADPDSGGTTLVEQWKWDRTSNQVTRESTWKQGETVLDTMVLDAENNLLEFHPPDVTQQPAAPVAGQPKAAAPWTQFTWDESGGTNSARDGFSATAGVTDTFQWDAQKLTETATNMSGESAVLASNAHGELTRMTGPLGDVADSIPDGEGTGTRSGFSATPTGATDFHELRVDEWGRSKRYYAGRFVPGPAAGPVQTVPEVPDHFPPAFGAWPPVRGTTLKDGVWGQGDGRTTCEFQFDAWGLPARFVDDECNLAFLRRDAHGRPFEWCDTTDNIPPFHNLVTAAYNVPDFSTVFTATYHSTDPLNPQSLTILRKQEYDVEGRLIRAVDGDGNAVYYTYDEGGHLYRMYDSGGTLNPNDTFNGNPVNLQGNVTTFSRDGLGRVRRVETLLTVDGIGGHALDTSPQYNPDGKLARAIVWDEAGYIRGYIDHANNLSDFRPDSTGRLSTINYASCAANPSGPTTWSRTYDSLNRVNTSTDANGVTLQYSYDGAGRVKTVTVLTPNVPGTQQLIFGYDDSGHLNHAEDKGSTAGVPFSHVVDYIVDSESHVRSATQDGRTIGYDYDGTGRRTLVSYPGSASVTCSYDTPGRLTQVVDGGQQIATFQYIGPDHVAQRVVMGVTTTYQYKQGSGVLTGMTVKGLVNPFSLSYTITPDRAGRLLTVQRTIAGPATVTDTRTWTYDSAGRVIAQTLTAAPGWSFTSETVTRKFDGDNALLFEQTDTTSQPPTPSVQRNRKREERGRVVSDDGIAPPIIYYDKNGNLTTLGERVYTYDAFQRLIQVTWLGAIVAQYEYDALNRLVRRVGPSGQIEEFVWDGWRLIEVWLIGQTAATTVMTERYVYGDGLDVLTAEINQQRNVVLHSPEGSIEGLVDTGLNAEFYSYSLGGEYQLVGADWVPVAASLRAPRSRMLFHGALWDPAAQCYYFRKRWYPPQFNQFATPDQAGAGQSSNLYAYALCDPINKHDPMGTFGIWISKDTKLLIDPVAGLKAGWGALQAVVDGVAEPLRAVVDLVGVAGDDRPRTRHYYSSIGKMAAEGMGYTDIGMAMARGVWHTPDRIADALWAGDAEGFGREAMTAYMTATSVAKGLTTIGRYSANFALNRNIFGLSRYREAFRNWQLRGYHRRVRRMMGRDYQAPSELRYDPSTGAGDAWFSRGEKIIGVRESSFQSGLWKSLPSLERPGYSSFYTWRSFFRGLRELFRGRNRLFSFGTYALGLRKLLKGVCPETDLMHELWHARQGQLWGPDFLRNFPNDFVDPFEYTMDHNWQQLDRGPVTGAHNYAFRNGPLSPGRDFLVRASVSVNAASTRKRRDAAKWGD